MKFRSNIRPALLLLALTTSSISQALELKVTAQNLSNPGGLYNTPVWIGFHDGTFDAFDTGQLASPGVERIAEDGDPSVLSGEFSAAVIDGLDAVIFDPDGFAGAPVFDPGNAASLVVDVDPATQSYFSFATMIIPTNDAFIANDDPLAYRLFDAEGEFTGPISFVVYGSQVLDAGTEENTEVDAAFINQTEGDAGVTTADNISPHVGLNGSLALPDALPQNILGGTTTAGTIIDPVEGDFSRTNIQMLRITISSNTTPVRVAVKNMSPSNGLYLTPIWAGFHDGSFDAFDLGESASPGVERIAEDGDPSVLVGEFAASDAGQDTVIFDPAGFAGAPVFDPGNSSSVVVNLDSTRERYFSFASMIIPSNDAFIGNDDAIAYEIFDQAGQFSGPLIINVAGDTVKDAGTEANTESDAAFINQTAGNTGETTADAIALHPGFNGSLGNPAGTPQNILGGTNAAGELIDTIAGDFTTAGYQIAQIVISSAVDGSFSDNWYVVGREGEGFQVHIFRDADGNLRAIVAWYTYAPDGSGNQVWLIGSGPVVGQHIIVDLFQTSGTTFGVDFDPADVLVQLWGQITLNFSSCTEMAAHYVAVDATFGSGDLDATRLTSGPADYVGACQL